MNEPNGIVRMNIAAMTQDDRLILRAALRANLLGYSEPAKAEAEGVITALTEEIDRHWKAIS